MGSIQRKIEIQRKTDLLETYLRDVRAANPVVIDQALLAEQQVIYATPPSLVIPAGR